MYLPTICLFLLISVQMNWAKICPCDSAAGGDSFAAENLVNDQTFDDDSNSPSNEIYPNLADFYSSSEQKLPAIVFDGRRLKRPSWAAVGKRSKIFIHKRPSWAQVG